MNDPHKPESQTKKEPERIIYADEADFMKSIPIEGSLGILAYGARGLIAWRKKQIKIMQQNNIHRKDNHEGRQKSF